MPENEEEVNCEECLYWNDDLKECEIEKEPDDNGKCENYT